MSRRCIIAALALAPLTASIGAAAAQADKPFRLTCEGKLTVRNGNYMFAEGSKPLNPNTDDDIACAHVAIAETPSRSAVKQS